VATLLAWLEEPESFHSQEDLHSQLSRLTKAELIDRLLEICEIYPEVAEAMVEGEAFDHKAAMEMAFSSLHPSDDWDEEKAVAGLELVARKAEDLLERGEYEQARRIYHALIVGCLKIDEEYVSTEIFPVGLVARFAEGYEEAVRADSQWKGHIDEIMKEIREIERFDFIAEQEGVFLEELKAELADV
jgi:tetratricopeptide (TPR) repeat protein